MSLASPSSTFWSGSCVGQQWRLGQRITAEHLAAADDGRAGRRVGGSGSASRRSNVSLSELVAAGVVQPGDGIISVTYKGVFYTASLNASGAIEFEGATFTSPTAFSIHVKRKQTPGKQGDDGWQSVQYQGIPLAQFRKEYLERGGGGGTGATGRQQCQQASGSAGAATSQQQVQQDAAGTAQTQAPGAAAAAAQGGGTGGFAGSGRPKRRRKASSRYSESDEEEQHYGYGGSYAGLEDMAEDVEVGEQLGTVLLPVGTGGLSGPSPYKIGEELVVDLPPGAQVEGADEWVQCERCQLWRLVPKEWTQAVLDDPRQEWMCEYAQWDVSSQPPHKPACEIPPDANRASGRAAAGSGAKRRGKRR